MNNSSQQKGLASIVMRLSAVSVLSQCINLAGLLFISRVYSPSEVGQWALFMTIGLFLQLFAGMRYELALIFNKSTRATKALLSLIILIVVMLSFIIVILYMLWPLVMGDAYASYQLFLIAFALYVLGWGLINIGISLATRRSHYRIIATNQLLTATGTITIQLALGELHWFGNGLIAGTSLAFFIVGIFFMTVYRADFSYALQHLYHGKRGLYEIRVAMRRYKSFPMYALPYAVLSNLHMQLTAIAIGAWYGLANLGYFNLAQRTLYAPIAFTNSSLSQVLMPKLHTVHTNPDTMRRLFEAVIRVMGYAISLPLACVSMWGQEIYAFIFGENWNITGIYAAALVPAIFAMAMTLWMERIFDALRKQRLHLLLSTGLNSLILIVFWIVHALYDDPTKTILAWSYGMLIYAVIWLLVVFKLCRFRVTRLVYILLELTCIALACLGLCFFIHNTSTSMWDAALSVIASAIVFVGLTWLRLKTDLVTLWRS